MKLSEVIPEAIRLSREADVYWEAELPKRHPDYPLVNPGEDSGPPPPQEVQLRKLLTELPKEMVYKLLLLMYLGRGLFDTHDLAGHFEELKEMFPKREWAVSVMVEHPSLPDYLTDGLAKLSDNKIDMDRWSPKPARPRK